MEKIKITRIEDAIKELNIEDDDYSCERKPPTEIDLCENEQDGTLEKYWDNLSEGCSSD